jgi:hypothetical protein
MIAPGLLPAHHAVRLKEHRAVGVWAVAVAASTIATAALTALFLASIPEDDMSAGMRIDHARQLIAENDRAAADWRAKAVVAARAIDARKVVGEHPDWGLLLERITARLGPDIAVEEFDFGVTLLAEKPEKSDKAEPAETKPDHDKAPRRRRWTVTLAGLSPKQSAVAEIVTGLERWGVFDRVRIIESKSRSVRGVDAAAFKIEAVIEEGTR